MAFVMGILLSGSHEVLAADGGGQQELSLIFSANFDNQNLEELFSNVSLISI